MTFWQRVRNFFCGKKKEPEFNQSIFPKREWALRVWELVGDMPKVSDGKEFFKDGMNRQNWVHLFAAMAKNESNFHPFLTYKESFKNSHGEFVISTGLFQISYESVGGYGYRGLTTNDLKNALLNIEISVAIMKRLCGQDGRIAGKKPNGDWAGGARYWSVLRANKVKNTLNQMGA